MKSNLKLDIQTGKWAYGSKTRSGLCAHTGLGKAPSLLVQVGSGRNDTAGEIYHARWVPSKSFILKRTETQKGTTGGSESLAAV